MIIAILSILILTILVWAVNKKLLSQTLQICPICAGVTLTWLWLLLAIGLGFLPASRYEFVTAILMGASIGGIVTELKKMFLKIRSRRESANVGALKKQLDDCC